MKIGYRTVKTAVGSGIALLLAQGLDLQHFSTVAVITLISIQSTRRQSFAIAVQRFLACLLAGAVGIFLFEQLGYQLLSIVIYLLIILPLLTLLRLQEGIVLSTVIVFQMYVIGGITVDLILNQVILVTIGIGVALLMNLYMPSVEHELHETKEEIEKQLQFIFASVALRMKHLDANFSKEILTEAGELIEKGKSLAIRELENTLLSKNDYYYHYFEMRERQYRVLCYRIVPLISKLSHQYQQTGMIATFVEEISLSIDEANTGKELMEGLQALLREMEQMDLPKTRQEFETRSSLINIVRELEVFLQIKGTFAAAWKKL